MRPCGRYLGVMAVSWVLAASVVAGFTLSVDAVGISPLRITIPGFNAWKPLQNDYDWIVKRYDVRRSHPTTIIMGSSRIKQSIDPRLLANTQFAPVYNAGLNAIAAFAEIKPYLQDYLRADANLRYVFIEAFVLRLLSYPEPSPGMRPFQDPSFKRPARVEFGVISDMADFTSVFFSIEGLRSAIRTISLNRHQPNSLFAGSSAGFAPIPLTSHHFSVRNAFNFLIHTGLLRRGANVSGSTIAAAREMIEDCKSHGVECRFFVSPVHSNVLFAAYYLNLWPELEKLKRGLSELAPTYDFTRYSHMIDERTGPVVYWPEMSHFSPAWANWLQER